MKFVSLLKRGMNLVKVGRAVRTLKTADDADKRTWAKQYLVEILGKSRGLPAKVGQFMTLGEDDAELRETLNGAIPPMPVDQAVSILETALQAPLDTHFQSLNDTPKAASLGQVHFGKLKDGTPVAVKVQYPDIRQAVESEMDLLGWMPKVGPVAKWGFSMEGYRDAFWDNFRKELDYGREIRHQQQYRRMIPPLTDVVVPEVFEALCRPNVLVQRLEEGFDLDKAASLHPPQKQTLGRVLLSHYLHMLFNHGFVHADPQPGNFAFRQTGRDRYALILYDFGCVLEINDTVRLALLRTILALQSHENADPVDCLALAGFDAEKLEDLRPTLPALLQVLFEPFLCEGPYDIKDWRLSERFDAIVGDLKWWFRSAAPPELIFLMRTLHGLAVMLERLDAKLPWKFLLEKHCAEQFPAARALKLPPSSAAAVGFNGIARYLQVYVVKPNGNKVKLTMPARVADDLKGVIDPPVMESIERQNIDLDAIQKRARQTGFVPQLLFDLKDPEREVKVWLE